jgi:hypothetical protein
VEAVAELLTSDDLPPGFDYPPEFVRIVELGLTSLEPWEMLTGEELRRVYSGLRKRYPDQVYVPFAARQDNDDIACWPGSCPGVIIVHDFASPGWERQGQAPSFHAWLRAALEDCIEWGEEELGLGRATGWVNRFNPGLG